MAPRWDLMLLAGALALIFMGSTTPIPSPPDATARLVVGFTRLVDPGLVLSLEGEPGTAAKRGPGREPAGLLVRERLAHRTLDRLVEDGRVASTIADALRTTLGTREAPRDMAVYFIADLADGTGTAVADRRNPGFANDAVKHAFGQYVPVVANDRLDDGDIRQLLGRVVRTERFAPSAWSTSP